VEFDYHYDVSAFFENFDFLKQTKIAELSGINTGLLRQYASGVKHPSPTQAKKIEIAIHKLAKELEAGFVVCCLSLLFQLSLQKLSGVTSFGFLNHLFGRTGKQKIASFFFSSLGAEVNYPIGTFNYFEVVFDNNYRMTQIDQRINGFQ
jgi:hypothetical protein